MMIDPDIEACHELRCTCDSGMFLTVVFAFRGWWQAEGSRTNLKSMSVQVKCGHIIVIFIAESFNKLEYLMVCS